MRTAVKGFTDVVVFMGDTRQDRAGACCAGAAVLGGREAVVETEAAEHLVEKSGNKVGFQSRLCMLWQRRQAEGISKLRCPGQALLHCQSSNVASKPSTDSLSTCHQTATANAASHKV